MGLPVIAIPFMTLVIGLPAAVALLPVTLIAANVWQIAITPHRKWALRVFWSAAVLIPVGTAIGVWSLGSLDIDRLKIMAAVMLMAFVVFQAVQPNWRVRFRAIRWLGPLAGLIAGIIGGVAAIFAPAVVTFLLSLGLPRDRFVAAIGLLYLVASLSLAFFLAAFSLMTPATWVASALAFIPVLIGQFAGAQARAYIPARQFRRVVLVISFTGGASLFLTAL